MEESYSDNIETIFDNDAQTLANWKIPLKLKIRLVKFKIYRFIKSKKSH